MSAPGRDDICYLTAIETLGHLRAGLVTAEELADSILHRIRTVDGFVNSYTAVFDKTYLASARASDERLRVGAARALDGITVSVKDLIAVAGQRLTRGSHLFNDFVPQHDAPVVERIRAACGLISGKTTTSELGWKCVTDSPLFGITRNPWDLDRTAGGSSGGAAAAVAAGLSTIALATDAAGSTRIPASFCGVVGLKPTFAAIPIYPAPAAASIVHVGLITRSVTDVAFALSVLGGRDTRDRFSAASALDPGEVSFDVSPDRAVTRGIRVGWTSDFGRLPVDDEIAGAVRRAAEALRNRGILAAQLSVSMPETDATFRTYFYATLGAQLRTFDDASLAVIDPGLRQVVDESRSTSAHDLIAADLRRAELWEWLRRVLEDVDVVMCPVAGTTAFEIGRDSPATRSAGLATSTSWMEFVYPFNLVGVPALAVPAGRDRHGLPIGVQLVARHWDEATLFSVGSILESELGSIGWPDPLAHARQEDAASERVGSA